MRSWPSHCCDPFDCNNVLSTAPEGRWTPKSTCYVRPTFPYSGHQQCQDKPWYDGGVDRGVPARNPTCFYLRLPPTARPIRSPQAAQCRREGFFIARLSQAKMRTRVTTPRRCSPSKSTNSFMHAASCRPWKAAAAASLQLAAKTTTARDWLLVTAR